MSYSPNSIPSPVDPTVESIRGGYTYFLESETDASNLPSFQCEAYERMLPMWTLVNDVYAGTDAIRAKASEYIPKFPIESSDAYQERCDRAVLMNIYARTVDAMVGLVIGSGLTTDGIPEQMKEHLKNINNAGTEFSVFARDILRDAFNGHCVVLIDMPDLTEDEMPTYKTDPKAKALRPYWTRWKPEDICNWRTTVIKGETVISQITFRECVTVPAGDFGETEEKRYLVWYLTVDEKGKTVAAFKKYREVEVEVPIGKSNRKKRDIRFELISEKVTHLSKIPIFVVYGDQRDGKILESRPPLLDLAHKNIEHLQIDSDYKKGLSIAGIAIPVLKTMKNEDELEKVFGWDQIMCVGEDEEFEWKEANGLALPNKRQSLEDIKREMAVLGLSLIAERADANITATERVLDSVQQSNQLMSIQESLIQGLASGSGNPRRMAQDLPFQRRRWNNRYTGS
jgi:hypothetical protein